MSPDALDPPFVPLAFERLPLAQMQTRAREFALELARRRSVRHFSSEPIPLALIDECIATAGSAPSGAHRQPWTFVVVVDASIKHQIRLAAEEEERINYGGRMGAEWLEALQPLGTNAEKPFLDDAPALIVVFRHVYGLEHTGDEAHDAVHVKNYYTQESVGIACGFLLAALHHAGLATLTHTPSPMGFLQQILARPENERAYLLIPVGYPVPACEVPNLQRKRLDEIRVRL